MYSQKNLKEMISTAELSLGDGMPMAKSSSASHIAVLVRQYVNELENPSFVLVPLFGQETTLQVRAILSSAAAAKASLRSSTASEAQDNKDKGWFAKFCEWFASSGTLVTDENAEEVKKTLHYLDQASCQLAALFDVILIIN